MRDHEHTDSGEVSRCLECERDVLTALTELTRGLSDHARPDLHSSGAQRLLDVAARARRIHALNCALPLVPVKAVVEGQVTP